MTSDERRENRYQRRKAKRHRIVVDRSREYSEFESVFGYDKLYDAFKKSAKGVKWKGSVQAYESNLMVNTIRSHKELKEGSWKSKGFKEFTIVERGKLRRIQSVHISERCIQRTFSDNCLIPIIKPHLIYDNGASLKNKGTAFTIRRFVSHLEKHIKKYGIKGYIYFFDFSSYFQNIDNKILTKNVHKILRDPLMAELYNKLIFAFGNIGIGLGSQVCQISAIYYPNQVDHLIKDKLSISGYGRYMDDGYIIHNNINELKRIVKAFKEMCDSLGIAMNKKKCKIIKLTDPFIYLKVRFNITSSGKIIRRINRSASTKERRRLRKFKSLVEDGIMQFEEVLNSFHSWLCSYSNRNSFHIRLNMVRYFNSLFEENYARYFPPKVKNRKCKVLAYIARIA